MSRELVQKDMRLVSLVLLVPKKSILPHFQKNVSIFGRQVYYRVTCDRGVLCCILREGPVDCKLWGIWTAILQRAAPFAGSVLMESLSTYSFHLHHIFLILSKFKGWYLLIRNVIRTSVSVYGQWRLVAVYVFFSRYFMNGRLTLLLEI